MKVQLELSGTPIDGWLKTDDVHARITAMQLFGEPAANRRADAEMSLTSTLPRFSRHADYRGARSAKGDEAAAHSRRRVRHGASPCEHSQGPLARPREGETGGASQP